MLVALAGLWAGSGLACGGLCGPRFRWEEDADDASVASQQDADEDALPWAWRRAARLRVLDAYEFCLTVRAPGGPRKEAAEEPFEGLERVLAAAGLPSVPPPARRGVLSDALFAPPPPQAPPTKTCPSPRCAAPSPPASCNP